MNEPQVVLRSARWSELIFAILALYLAASLPLRPRDHGGLWLLVQWYGMALAAFGLSVALRRPSRASWVGAVVLSAYFAVICAVGAVTPRRGGAAAGYAGPAVVLSYIILGIALLAQFNVALRCWGARRIWRRPAPGEIVAPVA